MRRPAALLALAAAAACAQQRARPVGEPPAPAAPAEHVLRPEALDPTADRWLEDQYATLDPRAEAAGKLVVYLVGANGKPSGSRTMLRELAAMGFHAVAPHYANDYGITRVCAPDRDPDEDCHGKVRREAFEGRDLSPHITVSRPNSAEGRVARMLAHLDRAQPRAGWGRFLDGEQPRWNEILVAGHSHGASTAGLVGKIRQVHRVVMLSGPFDNRRGEPAPWTRLPPATSLDRFYGFSHRDEDQHPGHLRDWEAMGLAALGAPLLVDEAAPPFSGSHQLITAIAATPGKNPHGVTVAGGASPRGPDGAWRLGPVWRHLFGR